MFDKIIAAMVKSHGVNPEWGVCVPSVQSGSDRKEYHFLVGRNIETFTQTQVDEALAADHVSVAVAYEETHFQMEPEPEEVVIAPAQIEAEVVTAESPKKRKSK